VKIDSLALNKPQDFRLLTIHRTANPTTCAAT
jgi:hypothetical protein